MSSSPGTTIADSGGFCFSQDLMGDKPFFLYLENIDMSKILLYRWMYDPLESVYQSAWFGASASDSQGEATNDTGLA